MIELADQWPNDVCYLRRFLSPILFGSPSPTIAVTRLCLKQQMPLKEI